MEINPFGVVVAFLLFYVMAVFVAMGVLLLLQMLNLIRFKRQSHFFIGSLILGLVLLVSYWLIRSNNGRKNVEPVSIMTDTIHVAK